MMLKEFKNREKLIQTVVFMQIKSFGYFDYFSTS